MNDANPSADSLGEGFAFARWLVDVLEPQGICHPSPRNLGSLETGGGWRCLYCRQDWLKLQGRDWRTA